ncbi:uncharacterized protein LOC111042163 [Myzus persicae]|uniref:uncharacterized protein LOC111042163 n=1 Tax=Myzus persicae TaxID=13164 RepID=UPI000B938000|nr:uncharacterized protein LOC111042163 [Myzus persicae]
MADKSSEKYSCDNTNNTSAETTTPSNNMADKNGEDISGATCTILPSPEIISEVFYSFDDPDSELDPLQLSMKKIVGKLFNQISDDKLKIHDIDNDNDNDDVNVNENYQNDLVDINIDVNNEPNVYAADGDIQNNMLVALRKHENIEDTMCPSNFFFDYKNYKELFFSTENINFSTPELPLSLTLTPQLNFDVDFIKQDQQYIDFMSVFTEFDFCKPFLEKIFSYLSYKDIASMTKVSKTWRKAVSKSANAQKELEKVFIQAILYFCHKNASVTDEYKQLYDKILIHFKNQIQF